MTPTPPMFAVLHIADFALHAVLRNAADADMRPAALFSGQGKKSVILAANALARATGVNLGMSAPQAVARCANLLICAPQESAETEARAALLAVGFTLSPSIEDTAPGVCTVDVKGFDSSKLEPAVQGAVTKLATLGFPATAGIARTPLLALYAARRVDAGANPTFCVEESPTLFPTKETVLNVTHEKSFLSPLPLSAADPSPALAQILTSWGLRTLGDLTALPRDDIVHRFGTEGLALWTRANGGTSRPLHPVVPHETFSAQMEFEDEIETLEPLLFILRRFLDRLTVELHASQHVAAELRITLRLGDATTHARSFRLPEPTADAEILFRTLHTHLESLQTAASIAAVELEVTPARPLVRQQGLFETGLRDPHGFAETLARVSALVGAEHVGTPQLGDTYRPDTLRLVPPAPVIPPMSAPPLHPPIGLPLRRFRPPLPARLEIIDGKPTYLWTEYMCGEITDQSNAWPSNGEWWQPDRAWRRIEWDIALATGGIYRLLLIDQAFFIEGEYD